MTKQYLSVTALNRYLKAKFDQDANLSRVYIRAELSTVSYTHLAVYKRQGTLSAKDVIGEYEYH